MFLALALAHAQDATTLTVDEWAALKGGDVVIRADASSDDTTSTAFVVVNTTPAHLWPAVMDLQARLGENSTLTGIREYRRTGPYDFYVAVDMSVFGADVHFTNHYTCQGYSCTYTLDPSQPNDLERCDGTYKVEQVEGVTLLEYTSINRHHIHVPGWVRKWMAVDAVRNLMLKLKARAER